MEPVQQQLLLFQDSDVVLTALLYGSYVAWIGLVVSSVLRGREGATAAGATNGLTTPAPAGA
jgi:hypothetical protein